MKRLNVGAPVMVLAIAMLGCSSSSEPSEVDIQKVIQGQVNQNEYIDASTKANYATLTIKKVSRKAHDDPTGLSVTNCTIEQTAAKPFNSSGTNTLTDTIALSKGSNGWTIYGMYMVK
jgi:hypothetical protein